MKTVPLRRIATFTYGDALASEARIDGAVPVMSSGGISGCHSVANTLSPVIVVGRKGSHGSVWWSQLPVFVIDTAYSIDATNTAADLRWLYYVLGTLDLGSLSNDVGVPGLSREAAYSAPVPVVPLNEQRRIADFLDDRVARIDQIITARRTQELAVDEAFSAERRDAVVGAGSRHRLIETRLPWARHASPDRAVRRLSQLARMGTGHTPSRSESSYWVDCDIPWLTTSDVHRFRRDEVDRIADTAVCISSLGLANSAAVLHPAETVALSRTASAGFAIVMGQAMATSQDFVTWTCGPDLRPDFLLHTLRVMRPFLLGNLATGSTHKTIYFPDLMDLRVLAPPVDVQVSAVGSVQEAAARRNAALGALRRQVDLLTEYKQSLITAAVNGELDVTTAGSDIPR